jgi:hypothetical protein
MGLAIGHTALAAATGLLCRFRRCIFTVDLGEIFFPLVRFPLFGHFLAHGHEFQHGLLGHNASSVDWKVRIAGAWRDKKTAMLTYLRLFSARGHSAA